MGTLAGMMSSGQLMPPNVSRETEDEGEMEEADEAEESGENDRD